MLSLDISQFLLELKDGAFKNVGPPNKAATVKLYDVDDAEAREFGDERVKLAFADDEGNEVEVALFPDQAEAVREQLATLAAESDIYE
jgi:hypothetical protein